MSSKKNQICCVVEQVKKLTKRVQELEGNDFVPVYAHATTGPSSGQVIPIAIGDYVNFGGVQIGRGINSALALNGDEFIVPRKGVYAVQFAVSNIENPARFELLANGVPQESREILVSTSGSINSQLKLNAGDRIAVRSDTGTEYENAQLSIKLLAVHQT